MNTQEIEFSVRVRRTRGEPAQYRVSGLLLRPGDARCLYVFGHGAGAGMRHRFMQEVSEALGHAGIATFRYNFPYMQAGKRRPDHRKTLLATVESAVVAAFQLAPDLPLFAGGKSMGGRMTSMASAEDRLPGVLGLIFLGFPLHPPGKPGLERAEHLKHVKVPMLFLQGTRDTFATPELRDAVVTDLPGAILHLVEGGDHSFNVPKRSGRTPEEVRNEVISTISTWVDGNLD